VEEMIAENYQVVSELKDLGGRPSAAVNPDPDRQSDEAERVFTELQRWRWFRYRQRRVRASLERFERYTDDVLRYAQEEKIEWTVNLQLDLEQQTKLDEWKEYYIFEGRIRRYLVKNLEQILQKPDAERSCYKLKYARRDLSRKDALLEWIKQQIPVVAAECGVSSPKSPTHCTLTHKTQARNAEPSPGRTASKTSQPKPSVLAPIHSSKVSKKSHSDRHSPNQKRAITFNTGKGAYSPRNHYHEGEQGRVQSPPSGPAPRSERIFKRDCNSAPPSFRSPVVSPDRSHTTVPQSLASETSLSRPELSKKRKFELSTAAEPSHRQSPGTADDGSRKRTCQSYLQPEDPSANDRSNSFGTSRTERTILHSAGRQALRPSNRGNFRITKQTQPSANKLLGPVHGSKISKSSRNEKPSSPAKIEQVVKGIGLS